MNMLLSIQIHPTNLDALVNFLFNQIFKKKKIGNLMHPM